MTMGVYCIQVEKEHYWCSYVGISKNIEKRWSNHKIELRKNTHDNPYLQRAWNKYGEKNFEFHILEETNNYDELYFLEKLYGYHFGYGDFDLCFNIAKLGEISSTIGRKHTEETKIKIGEGQKGKKRTEETKQQMREARQGEKSSTAVLTEEEARFILTVKTTRKNQNSGDFKQRELADYFGVSVGCIQQVMARVSWKYIEPMSIKEYEEFKKNL